jgi:hypothetical protein
MDEIPLYPKYQVEVMDDDAASFITNTRAVRVTTRVPEELWDEFKDRLGMLREITDGR